jgi:Chaperone of endosialidase
MGISALSQNTTADDNTAVGAVALFDNTIGNQNTAIGSSALHNNATGSNNTANGYQALSSNFSGDRNTATGWQALFSNTGANNNTADGFQALHSNTTGGNNTGIGFGALETSTTSNSNTAIGANALSNTTGSGNIALGSAAGTAVLAGDNNIHIGNGGSNIDTDTIRIGLQGTQTQTFIAGIRGTTTGFANAVNVLIDSNGQLGTMNSSRQFKHKIEPMESASESILALRPVSFCYKRDKTDTSQFGLIAEEVAEVNPDLVVRDENGEIYTVRYDAVNAMLLNEFLKEHARMEEQDRKIQKQEATITQLKKDVDTLVTRLEEHDSKIQQVCDKIETSRSASQMALSD